MRNISVNTEAMESQITNIQNLSQSMNSVHSGLDSIRKELLRRHTIFGGIGSIIVFIMDKQVIDDACKLDSLEAALQHIVEAYQAAENNAINGAGTNNKIEVTRTMEKQHDLMMQNEIFNIMKEEPFTKTTWANASLEEKEEILLKFVKRLNKALGINVTVVNFAQLDENVLGSYSPDTKEVSISTDYLNEKDSYRMMSVLVHEMRHAYQDAAVNDPDSFDVSPETIKEWSDNFTHYKNDGYTYEQYVSQPIEWDAHNFAKQITDSSRFSPEYEGSWN